MAGVSKAGRDAMVEAFQGEGGPPIMVLSLKAGGTGLNLTAAPTMSFISTDGGTPR